MSHSIDKSKTLADTGLELTPSADAVAPSQQVGQNQKEIVDQIKAVLTQESAAISEVAQRIDLSIVQAIQLLLKCQGRVIVSGMGKMGCIARKAAATFCSTGTPAIFLHPGEAAHGDLGIVTQNDVLIVLSSSGQTRELRELLPHVVRLGVPIIGLVGDLGSSLASQCNVTLDIGVAGEADPISVAPTCSTTVALAMSDAIAVALMHQRGFTQEQFAIFHPGGNLGGKLLVQVADLMHTGDDVPTVKANDPLQTGIDTISAKGLGSVFVVSDSNEVLGVITDGDLRRMIQRTIGGEQSPSTALSDPVNNHMTSNPKSISVDALAAEALRLMQDNEITVLPVVKAAKLVGVIHLHDLIRAGLA